MIVWQGAGILGGIIPILFYVLTGMVVRAMAGDGYLKTHSWPGALGTLIGAAAVWALAKWLDRPGTFKRTHALFYIPLNYFAVVLSVVAIAMLFFKHDSSL